MSQVMNVIQKDETGESKWWCTKFMMMQTIHDGDNLIMMVHDNVKHWWGQKIMMMMTMDDGTDQG